MTRARITLRWLLLGGLLIALMATITAFYARTRPALAPDHRRDRLQEVHRMDVSSYPPRAATALLREFCLDYPDMKEPGLRLKLAASLADQPDTDFAFVADQTEQVAADVLAHAAPDSTPTRQDFEKAGFEFQSYYGMWHDLFIRADVDGDGRPDVVLVYPPIKPGAAYIFRHTSQGWVKHRLAIGTPILGLWVFDIVKGGPKAILLASLADSVYDPNLFVDVFVWQNGRVNNVLSTQIPHGFQWDHKDLDGDGLQEIRLFGHTARPEYGQQQPPQILLTYKWNGSTFVLERTPSNGTPPQNATTGHILPLSAQAISQRRPNAVPQASMTSLDAALNAIEDRLFEHRNYSVVLEELAAFEDDVRASSLPVADKNDLLLETLYHEALCYRKLGQAQRAAVLYAALWRGHPDSVWGESAKRFLALP
jgi:hypothetical protein